MELYIRRLDSTEAVEHRDEIDLLSARKDDLLSRMAENDNPRRWKDASEAFARFDEARQDFDEYGRTSDKIKMDKALKQLGEIILNGYTYEFQAWQQLMGVMDALRRVKDSEIRRRQKAAETISEHQVQSLIGALVTIVNTHVRPEDREKVLGELRRIKIGV